ncbi:MAG: arginyltransferase [Pseudomonadota bacterium]
MSEQNSNFPQFYVTSEQACPYLPGQRERKLFTHLTPDRSPQLVDTMLRGGFRRSQHIAYLPYCQNCSACVSVRVPVDTFAPSRSQKRILNNTRMLEGRVADASVTGEHYDLFRDYIDDRHGDGGMADMSVMDFTMMIEDSTVPTHIYEYRERRDRDPAKPENPLVASALVDRLSDGLSMVYSYFDPAWARSSLGTFMILDHIARCRTLGLPYLYLGYWIAGSRTMGYKTKFRPQEHLTASGWRVWDGT